MNGIEQQEASQGWPMPSFVVGAPARARQGVSVMMDTYAMPFLHFK